VRLDSKKKSNLKVEVYIGYFIQKSARLLNFPSDEIRELR